MIGNPELNQQLWTFRQKILNKGNSAPTPTDAPEVIDVAPPFTVNGKRAIPFRGRHHSVRVSFHNPVGFFYKNKKTGISVSMSFSSFEDFEDEEKCLKALERLYVRAIEYNELSGERVPTTRTQLLLSRISAFLSDFRQ